MASIILTQIGRPKTFIAWILEWSFTIIITKYLFTLSSFNFVVFLKLTYHLNI